MLLLSSSIDAIQSTIALATRSGCLLSDHQTLKAGKNPAPSASKPNVNVILHSHSVLVAADKTYHAPIWDITGEPQAHQMSQTRKPALPSLQHPRLNPPLSRLPHLIRES